MKKKNIFPIDELNKRQAELLAENFLSSEEGLQFKTTMEREFLDYAIYGITQTDYLNKELLDDIIQISCLTKEEIIEKCKL